MLLLRTAYHCGILPHNFWSFKLVQILVSKIFVWQSLLPSSLLKSSYYIITKYNMSAAESALSIIIKYCQSWGYKNQFVKTANYLNKYFPEAHIEGGIYPPPSMYQMIATFASYLFFIGLILIFFGETIAQSVNIPQVREICTMISQFSLIPNPIQIYILFFSFNAKLRLFTSLTYYKQK